LCLDFCNSGGGTRRASGAEWIASFTDLIDWLEAAEAVTGSQAASFVSRRGIAPRRNPGMESGDQVSEALFRF